MYFKEWQAALVHLKVLFWEEQHKKCLAMCEELLEQAAAAEVSHLRYSKPMAEHP